MPPQFLVDVLEPNILESNVLESNVLEPNVLEPNILELETAETLEEISISANGDVIDISHLVIEDDEPVDNFYSAQQQRFSVQAVTEAEIFDEPFLIEANVGLFYDINKDPIVPDVLLSLGVQQADDYSLKRNRSYFVWEMGKLPELCIEIVSNKKGDEVNLSRKSRNKGKTLSKKELYAKIGIQYYVVFDPLEQLKSEMNQAMLKIWTLSPDGDYPEELAQSIYNVGEMIWLEDLGVGLTLWQGEFEKRVSRVWMRWCDKNGQVHLTGGERARIVEQLAAEDRSRAENAESRAENAEAQARLLADRLRALGIDPDNL